VLYGCFLPPPRRMFVDVVLLYSQFAAKPAEMILFTRILLWWRLKNIYKLDKNFSCALLLCVVWRKRELKKSPICFHCLFLFVCLFDVVSYFDDSSCFFKYSDMSLIKEMRWRMSVWIEVHFRVDEEYQTVFEKLSWAQKIH
jgi:hypothetical protein